MTEKSAPVRHGKRKKSDVPKIVLPDPLELARRASQRTVYRVYEPSLGAEVARQTGTAQKFFYLIVRSGNSGALSQDDLQSYFRTGINTDSTYIFVFSDIDRDQRLRNSLIEKQGGEKFYAEIESKAPVFLITEQPLAKIDDLKEIRLVRINDYHKDIKQVYYEMGFNPSARRSLINFAKRANKYLSLKPGAFGISVDLQKIFDDLLDRFEERSP